MKFAFHVPTYRQQDWFAQCGWFPSRSTVNDLINYGVDTIDPLYEQMWHLLLEQPILLGDDTTAARAASRRAERGGAGAAGPTQQAFAKRWTRASRGTPARPVRPPVTRGCTRDWTAWRRTTSSTGR